MQVINDFNTSVAKAFSELDPKWRDYKGLVVCGSHTPTNVEQTIDMIQEAREKRIPFYGECFGYQLACIEWARNVDGIKDATSEEFKGKGTYVIKKRKELKVGLHEGESWWSNYEVDEKLANDFNLYKPRWFFAVPFHPSYQSSKAKPHPLIKDFLDLARYA